MLIMCITLNRKFQDHHREEYKNKKKISLVLYICVIHVPHKNTWQKRYLDLDLINGGHLPFDIKIFCIPICTYMYIFLFSDIQTTSIHIF